MTWFQPQTDDEFKSFITISPFDQNMSNFDR